MIARHYGPLMGKRASVRSSSVLNMGCWEREGPVIKCRLDTPLKGQYQGDPASCSPRRAVGRRERRGESVSFLPSLIGDPADTKQGGCT